MCWVKGFEMCVPDNAFFRVRLHKDAPINKVLACARLENAMAFLETHRWRWWKRRLLRGRIWSRILVWRGHVPEFVLEGQHWGELLWLGRGGYAVQRWLLELPIRGQRTRSNAHNIRRANAWPERWSMLLVGHWRASLGQIHGHNLRLKAQRKAQQAVKLRKATPPPKGAKAVRRSRDHKKSLWR